MIGDTSLPVSTQRWNSYHSVPTHLWRLKEMEQKESANKHGHCNGALGIYKVPPALVRREAGNEGPSHYGVSLVPIRSSYFVEKTEADARTERRQKLSDMPPR